jgi:hypothetical protein
VHPLAAVRPPAGLGLTGPGAEAAARGFVTAGLAAGGLDEPDERTWVVMPSVTAATLLGTDVVALPHTPRLTVSAGLDEALDLLEAQTLHRSRTRNRAGPRGHRRVGGADHARPTHQHREPSRA